MHRIYWGLFVFYFAFSSVGSVAVEKKVETTDEKVFVPAERPFDAVNMFGDFSKSVRLPDTDENKLWWERMIRGNVGKDRFLILCALKDGNWKKLGDIRDSIEFQSRETYPAAKLQDMLMLMGGKQRARYNDHHFKRVDAGEGWLERNRKAIYAGIDSEWRIEPSLLPLLYFLLMGCPESDRCQK